MGMIQGTQATWTQRVARTQAIMSAAWLLLKEQKQLLLLPIASSACLTLLTVAWAIPAVLGTLTGASLADAATQNELLSSAGAFLFSVVTYGVGIFFNAARDLCIAEA